MLKDNKVTLIGETRTFVESHKVLGEKFFETSVEVYRSSGATDKIPIIVSEILLDACYDNSVVVINGSVRTKNIGGHLKVAVFVDNIKLVENSDSDTNIVECLGTVCKPPTYRETPLGREITDLIIAVNRRYGKSDYLPCIVWGRNARYSQNFNVGDKVEFKGRFQSRIYKKNDEEKTAYEISVQNINKLEEDNED